MNEGATGAHEMQVLSLSFSPHELTSQLKLPHRQRGGAQTLSRDFRIGVFESGPQRERLPPNQGISARRRGGRDADEAPRNHSCGTLRAHSGLFECIGLGVL